MSKPMFPRRDFLRGLGATAAALPILSSLRASAQTEMFPKRLLVLFSANGTVRENWTPSGTENSFELSRILAPLEPHKSDIVVLDGLKNETAHHGPGDGHMTGMGCLWTATELLPGTQFKCGGTDPCSGWGGGISIDQHIANALYAAAPADMKPKFKSLELAVQAGGADVWSRMVYSGSDQPIAPMDDPSQVFTRVFGDLNVTQADLNRKRDQRLSVLDYVGGRLSGLRDRLSGEDRDKLEAHLTAVRGIEMQLTAGGFSSSCVQPDAPTSMNVQDNGNFPAILKLQTDLLVRAFACGMTQVATLQWSRSVSGTRHTWAGVSEGHHDLSHEGDSNGDALEKITKVNVWFAEQFAYLLEQLKSVPEGEGTLLDNTLIVWGNELGRGNSHARTKIPFVLAGRAGGALSTGRFLQYNDSDSHSNLLVSVGQLMGVDMETFGNPEYCDGPLRLLM